MDGLFFFMWRRCHLGILGEFPQNGPKMHQKCSNTCLYSKKWWKMIWKIEKSRFSHFSKLRKTKSSDVVFSGKVRFASVPSRYKHENNSGLQWSRWSVANIRPKYKHFLIPTAANLPSWAEMEKLYNITTKCWFFYTFAFCKISVLFIYTRWSLRTSCR